MDFASFFEQAGYVIKDYSFVIVAVITVLIVAGIIMFMVKHMPNKGKITELYDDNGKLKKKSKTKNKT